ncbi:hypothetical protein [Fusobacterium sp. PH5-44]|uniref:hypothetical protein n=1 Tax=unclassified Fusobacterium TaxID=2648384 RepID=UPI003D1C9A14
MEKKASTNWAGVIFGVIWLFMAVIIFALYLAGNLGPTFSVPRMIKWVYDLLGIQVGSITQIILSLFVIYSSVGKAPKS